MQNGSPHKPFARFLAADPFTNRTELTPLFEEERDASRLTLVSNRPCPIGVHRPRLKQAAGRELDGRTWDEFPEVHHAVV